LRCAIKCVDKCCEKRDDWDIHAECLGTETAAGSLKKSGAMGGLMWSKRYVTIDNNKIICYADQSRQVVKSEIVLVGASAQASTTHADKEKEFYFVVSHPECGTNEFMTRSAMRRAQWMSKINNLSAAITKNSIYGVILKQQGGLFNSGWKERWCVCTGRTLDWYETAADSLPKSGVILTGATIREATKADQKFCIEIEQNPTKTTKKSKKKYFFATLAEHDRAKWIEIMQACTVEVENKNMVDNPMLAAGGATGGGEEEEEKIKVERPTTSMKGILEKKATNLLARWQKRYFVLQCPKELDPTPSPTAPQPSPSIFFIWYYEDEASASKEYKGRIPIENILHPKREGATDLVFSMKDGRIYNLRAQTPQEAEEWLMEIDTWCTYVASLAKKS